MSEGEIEGLIGDLNCYISHAIHHRTMHLEDHTEVYTHCHLIMAVDLITTALVMIEKADWKNVIKGVGENAKVLAQEMDKMATELEAVDNSHLH